MQQAIVLDTETTGLDEPEVIELVRKGPFDWGQHSDPTVQLFHTRYKPSKPIEPGAMAVHRIIPGDLDGCPPWIGWTKPEAVGYMIGHKIDHDWTSLGKPDVKRICTLAMAKNLWDGLGSYNLTALIFHLFEPSTARQLTENAHEAETDVHLTCLLLDHLLWEIPAVQDFESLWKFSEQARIPLRIGFSKFGPKNGKPGTLYSEVPEGMLRWIIDPQRVNDMDPWEVKAAKRQLGIE